MINDHKIDQAFSDLAPVHGGVREDYFGLIYLEQEHGVERNRALNQVAFGGHDYGVDGFHFDEQRRNFYLFQFKWSESYAQFKGSLQRLITDGAERIFAAPQRDDAKNPLLIQLRSSLVENRALVDQVCFRFVFKGDPTEAERSPVIERLREDLENKKFLIDKFFEDRSVQLVVDFRSAAGRVGVLQAHKSTTTFKVPLTETIAVESPSGERMDVGFISLADLHKMHVALGPKFFDRNIRYGLGESEAVNRALSKALRQIVIERSDPPSAFGFHHNGITLFAEKVERIDGDWHLSQPRLLNGAQTVTTTTSFLESNKDHPQIESGRTLLESVRVLCKVITGGDQRFVTRVTVNNNRQNPVEPWNLHANDMVQLELQDKFRADLGIFYERQENAFDQLSVEDLDGYGITEESKAIQMLKLTQTFLLTDGQISRLSEIRRVFEDDKVYEQVFRKSRLKADSRHILLCYKVQFRLRKLAQEITQKGQSKYWFVQRARYLLWALLCQSLLNHEKIEKFADSYGTTMSLSSDYTELLITQATTRVRTLLSELMVDKDYSEKVRQENLSFLRTDRAFDKCMEYAYRRWHWVHKKLAV
jgi:hypothetical protein